MFTSIMGEAAPELLWQMTLLVSCPHSPKSLLTLRSTLSFSGSYGWSLLGISNTAGNASVNVSTRFLIFSATCRVRRHQPIHSAGGYDNRRYTNMLIYEHYRDILPGAGEVDECLLHGGSLRLIVDNKEILLSVWRLSDMLRFRISIFRYSRSRTPPTPTPASKSPVTESYMDVRSSFNPGCSVNPDLVTNDCNEISVLVCRRRSCHDTFSLLYRSIAITNPVRL